MEEQHRLRRLVDPLGDAYRRLGTDSATMNFLRQEDERRRLIANFVDVDVSAKLAADFERQRKLLEAPIGEARRLGLLDPTSDIRESMAAALTAHQEYQRLFRLPEIDEVSRLAREALNGAGLASRVLRDQEALQTAMAEVRKPWLRIEEATASAHAFSDILAIGRGIEARLSFDAAFVDALRPSLEIGGISQHPQSSYSSIRYFEPGSITSAALIPP